MFIYDYIRQKGVFRLSVVQADMPYKITLKDFEHMRYRYKKMENGERAEIRRAPSPECLVGTRPFYSLLPKIFLEDDDFRQRYIGQTARFVFLLPLLEDCEGKYPLGTYLAMGEVSDMRIMQLRKTNPADTAMVSLYRIIEIASKKKPLSFLSFGKTSNAVFYWGENEKRHLLGDFWAKQAQIKLN
jgi:hypothetical protein